MEINGHIDSLVFHLVHDDNDRWLATHQGDSQKVVTVSALVNMFKLALAQEQNIATESTAAPQAGWQSPTSAAISPNASEIGLQVY